MPVYLLMATGWAAEGLSLCGACAVVTRCSGVNLHCYGGENVYTLFGLSAESASTGLGRAFVSGPSVVQVELCGCEGDNACADAHLCL